MTRTYTVHEGRRYRLKFRNASDDIHPPHPAPVQRRIDAHRWQTDRRSDQDVVMLGEFEEVGSDFVADYPGLTLFHCHRQLHMDFGFTALFNYA